MHSRSRLWFMCFRIGEVVVEEHRSLPLLLRRRIDLARLPAVARQNPVGRRRSQLKPV